MILMRRRAKAQRELLRAGRGRRVGIEPGVVSVLIVFDATLRRHRLRQRLVADALTLIEEHERRRNVEKRLRRRAREQYRRRRRRGAAHRRASR